MELLTSLALGVLGSLIASVVFWLLTFKISRTDVIFSEQIEKSESVNGNGSPRYRIRLSNYGTRDLIEATVRIKIIVHLTIDNAAYLEDGNGGFLAILPKRKHRILRSFSLTMFPGKLAFEEYKKSFYDKRIQEKAQRGDLTLDDIISVYGEAVSIKVYVFGNDHLTGARRFAEKTYTINDIKEGKFELLSKRPAKNKASGIELLSNISHIEKTEPAEKIAAALEDVPENAD